MDLALAIAKTGLEAQHENIEIISNNLANANTTAFKKSRATFEDLPYQVTKLPGSATTQETDTTGGLVLGTGTQMINNTKEYSDGNVVPTDGDLNVAITGTGFFQVQLPNGGGFAYTRAGNLDRNEQGQIVDGNGYIIQPPITIAQGATAINISQDGIVSAILPGSTTSEQVGQLQLASFMNPDGLQPIGGNLYLATTSSGPETLGTPDNNGYGKITQHALEASNVNVVEEMVNLIEAQRAFEVTSKAVSAVDNMMDYLEKQT